MKTIAAAVILVCVLGTSKPACAWGEPGHQLIGSIAWAIVTQPGHDNARQNVQLLLNQIGTHTLGEAATWADCVRDVRKSASGFTLTYVHGKTPQICIDAFPQDNEAEAKAMMLYVRNNWSQCDDTYPGSGQCHATYHFDDIPYQHGQYAADELSTSKHDIVSVLGEAAYFLKNGHDSPDAVANFSDAREALFILAHLVGDIHQPLHVGAVYLDAQGHVVDPGHDEALAKQTSTRGGNSIADAASHAQQPPKLHGEWDKIRSALGTSATAAAAAQALDDVPPDQGDYLTWPETWASESVALARDTAFKGLTYTSQAPGSWTFQAPGGYDALRNTTQRLQLERAGVRLARLLIAIWPD